MPATAREHNRGPAAAAENRLAILDAARRVFAERGYHVPLNAIAREAGVGQGVLYRHFPTRLDLALTVFEQNFTELELLADDPEPGSFGRLWSRLLDLTIEEAAFVEMFVDARRTHADYDGADRLLALIAGPLARDQRAGIVDPGLTASDVVLAQRMAYGVVVTSLTPADARTAVDQVLGVLSERFRTSPARPRRSPPR